MTRTYGGLRIVAGVVAAALVLSTIPKGIAGASSASPPHASFSSQVELHLSDLPNGWLIDYQTSSPDTFAGEINKQLFLMSSSVTIESSSSAALAYYETKLSRLRHGFVTKRLKSLASSRVSALVVKGIAFPSLGDRDFAFLVTDTVLYGKTKVPSSSISVRVLVGRAIILLTSIDESSRFVAPVSLDEDVLNKMLARAHSLHL
jgi:hypothetical protein